MEKDNRHQVEAELNCIRSKYGLLSSFFPQLQKRLSILECIEKLDKIKSQLFHDIGKKKLIAKLGGNTGLQEILQVEDQLVSGTLIEGHFRVRKLSMEDIRAAKFAPSAANDVERNFCIYSDILSCKRHALTEDSLTKLTFLYINSQL